MPGVALHFLVARRALERIRCADRLRIFDPDDPVARNAFFHGAVGPDLGYFPGGHRALSDLAHCVRSGTLTRTLVESARTVRERAFALGWLSHVLADVRIHPLVGRGVGELLFGDGDRFVDGSSDFLAHLRVEMGVDAWFATRHPEVRGIRVAPVFDAASISFLAGAYRRVYRVALPSSAFLGSHTRTGRRVAQALASLGVVGALIEEGAIPTVRWALRAAWHVAGERHVSLAYLNPVPPSDWLLDAVQDEVEEVLDRFEEEVSGGLERLEDRNLDTGRLLIDEADHVGTQRALDFLSRQTPGRTGDRILEGPGGPADRWASPAMAAFHDA